jgi:hypothetical protein
MLAFILSAVSVCAEMQVELNKRQPLGKTPLDIAQSVSDGRLFVLLEGVRSRFFLPTARSRSASRPTRM